MWRLFGKLSLPWRGGDLATVLGRKHLAVLACLLVSRAPVRRQQLAEALWPDSERQAARHNLRQSLVAIKKALGEAAERHLIADAETIAFRPAGLSVDVIRFSDIEMSDSVTAEDVADLCRGPVLEGFHTTSEPFEAILESWRRDYGARMLAVLDRTLRRGKVKRRVAAELRARMAAISADAPAADVVGAPQSDPRSGFDAAVPRWRRWSGYRYVIALSVGLTLGIAAIIAAYALSPGIRSYMRDAIIDPVPDAPSIAVRPFESLNGSPVERQLAGGVTIGVTYGLYSVTARELFVVTVPSDLEELVGIGGQEYAAEIGVRYLISGTVEQDGRNVRVFVRCLDAASGHDVWQDRFTRPVTEAFKLQDEIALRVLSGLEIDLSAAERNRLQYLDDTQDLQAWLFAANGVNNLIKISPKYLGEALRSYRRALQIDPDYISARRGLAWHALLQVRFGTSPDSDQSIVEARNHLNVILRHRPDDGMSKAVEGLLLLLEQSWQDAVEAGETASRLLPGSADVWAVLAHTYTFVGKQDQALDAIERAMSLSPGHPRFYQWIRARALRLSGRTADAIAILDQDIPADEDTLVRLVELAAAYSATGRLSDAQRVSSDILRLAPDFSASDWVLHPVMQDPVQQSLEFELLSKAGL